MRNISLTLAVALGVLASLSAKAQGIIAYDNTTGYQNAVTARPGIEHGDEINLTTGATTLTDFQFEYNYTGLTPATGVLRIYANDGAVLPGSAINRPGTLLLQSDPFALQNGFHQGAINGLSVTVPGRITWTVDFEGVTALDNAGLLYYNGVGVGSGPGQSNDDYWENLGTVAVPNWVLVESSTQSLIDNFGARVTVVPEPTTVGLLIAGAAVLGLAARRRKA